MALYLASDQSIASNDFLGLGTSQGGAPGFIRDNVVIPQTATISTLVFSIRNEALGIGDVVTAQIVISDDCGVTTTDTGIIATVISNATPTTPNTNCCAVALANFPVSQCDLLSVRIVKTVGTGALMNGAAATILFAT